MYTSEENYLKVIFEMSNGDYAVYIGNQALADYFDNSIQAVNEMVKKLDAKGYLNYVPYKGSKLTSLGREVSISLISKHRLWEVFLIEYCHYDWSEVHDEAERLEHATSDLLEKRLRKMLNFPEICPHGNPIPDTKGNYHRGDALCLVDAVADQSYKLVRVVDDVTLLQYLSSVGLVLGDCIYVERVDDYNQLMIINKDDDVIPIGFKVASYLYVNIQDTL